MSTISKDETIQMLLLKSQVALPNVSNKVLNIDAIDMSAVRPIQDHDSTAVTQATKQVERDLALSLLFVIEKIKRNRLKYTTEDVKQIQAIFRNHIQRAYQLGIAYANAIFETKGFIENRDINIIKFLTDYYTNVFINSIEKALNDPDFIFNIDRSILDIEQEQLEKSNIFNYIAHSTSATFQSLQIATVVKTIILFDMNSVYPNEGAVFGAETVPTLQFYWATSMDERVCPICMDLAKSTWVMADWFNLPLIPHGAHPNCRCRIMVKPVILKDDTLEAVEELVNS